MKVRKQPVCQRQCGRGKPSWPRAAPHSSAALLVKIITRTAGPGMRCTSTRSAMRWGDASSAASARRATAANVLNVGNGMALLDSDLADPSGDNEGRWFRIASEGIFWSPPRLYVGMVSGSRRQVWLALRRVRAFIIQKFIYALAS